MDPQTRSLTVVLPCYNEENSIRPVFSALLAERTRLLKSKTFSDIEIIAINDGSSDESLQRLQEFSSDVRIFSHTANLGYGHALKKGFQQARSEWICFFDLDRTCSPSDIQPLFQKLNSDGSGMALGTRINKHSQMPLLRALGNRMYRSLTSFLLKQSVSDCCTGFRIFHRKYLPLFIEPLPDQLNYSLAMTIAYLRSGGQLTEKHISYGEREGRSKLNAMIDGPRFLATLLQYSLSPKFSEKKLKGFLP